MLRLSPGMICGRAANLRKSVEQIDPSLIRATQLLLIADCGPATTGDTITCAGLALKVLEPAPQGGHVLVVELAEVERWMSEEWHE